MLRSEPLPSKLKILMRSAAPLICVVAAFLTLLPAAVGQDFTMTMGAFNPFAVDPGQDSASSITVSALNGFNGTVGLTCVVTSQNTGVTPPTCLISPPSLQPSGGATATIITTIPNGPPVTPGLYTITVTGTSPNTTIPQSQNLTVLAVTPQFTITVGTAVSPSSVPAGSGGQGIININPINGYSSGSGGVTLSCSSITPLVTLPPVCSFNPQPVPVNGVPATSTITISTQGPVTTGAAVHHNAFYGLWLPLPLLGLVGLGAAASGKGSRKAWGLLALMVMSGSILLMPACANSSSATTTPNGVTPNNSYTFTVTGVDTEGNISSNTTTTTNPSVSLTVTSPPTH